MKIVFLDMDGVLCTVRSHVAQKSPAPRGVMEALDREAVGLLNILMTMNVRAVLTSTWRNMHSRGWMENHLRRHGWEGEFHEDWRTVSRGEERERGREINEWLSRHRDAEEEIERYVILDDKEQFLPDQMPFFVQTHPHNGILWDDFLKAMAILHPEAMQKVA